MRRLENVLRKDAAIVMWHAKLKCATGQGNGNRTFFFRWRTNNAFKSFAAIGHWDDKEKENKNVSVRFWFDPQTFWTNETYIPVAYNHARTCLRSDAITSRQTGNRNKGAENDQPHHLFICVSLPTPFPVECREPGAKTKGVVGRVHRDSSHVVVVVWNLLYSVYTTILCGKAQAIWVTTVSRIVKTTKTMK